MKKHIEHLTPPLITSEHIKEKIICIRAHRERMFRVEPEIHNQKIIFHNYGQGGAGWTFLFGCVHESIRQLEEYIGTHHNKSIAIIGAGCYGLLTAIILARKGYDVTIFAKETENLPSHKAAGFFFPRPRKVSTPQECALFEKYGMESYRTYKQIASGDHTFIGYGPKLLPAYFAPDIDPGFSPYIYEGLIDKPEPILIDFGTGKLYDVMNYKAIFINSSAIMHELYRTIDEYGIKIVKTEIKTFDDITQSIIFNCAGMGAKQLTQDPRLIPVQGHLITLKNQPNLAELQYMLNVKVTMQSIRGTPRDELLYYAPKESGILGITFLRGQGSLTANQHEFERLLERCEKYFEVRPAG